MQKLDQRKHWERYLRETMKEKINLKMKGKCGRTMNKAKTNVEFVFEKLVVLALTLSLSKSANKTVESGRENPFRI